METIGSDDERLRFEARLVRMASPRVLLSLCRQSFLDREDTQTLSIVQEIARRIGASAASGAAGPLRSAFAPFGQWSQTEDFPGHLVLLDADQRVIACGADPPDALLRLQDAIECAVRGGFSLANERQWKASIVPVWSARDVIAVLCVLFAEARPPRGPPPTGPRRRSSSSERPASA